MLPESHKGRRKSMPHRSPVADQRYEVSGRIVGLFAQKQMVCLRPLAAIWQRS